LTVGTKLSEVYEKNIKKLKEDIPELADMAPEFFGYSVFYVT